MRDTSPLCINPCSYVHMGRVYGAREWNEIASIIIIHMLQHSLIKLVSKGKDKFSSDFSSKFQSSMTIFHHKLLTKEGVILANRWTHPSSLTTFVHLFIRNVIQRVTIVTLNTIWHKTSVVHYWLCKSLVKNHLYIGTGSLPLTRNFMRKAMIPNVTFLMPFSWMNLPSRVIH